VPPPHPLALAINIIGLLLIAKLFGTEIIIRRMRTKTGSVCGILLYTLFAGSQHEHTVLFHQRGILVC
jgi:hypothetical protein